MKTRRLVKAMALGASCVAVGLASHRGDGRDADVAAFHAVNGQHSPGRDRFFAGITELGSIWAAIGAAGMLAATGRRRTAARALGAALVTWALGQALKRAFLRPRPFDAHPQSTRVLIGRPGSMSWPSSHPAVLATFTSVAARDLGVGGLGRSLLAGLAGAVGTSRTYLGVHYPSDVAGGLLLGRAVGLAWPDARQDGE